jgi:hypothetical protein
MAWGTSFKWLVAVLSVLVAAGCATTSHDRNDAQAVSHLVLCWLKDPGNADHRRRIIERSKGFRFMQGVLTVSTGEVVESERAIVDDSFDVGIVIRFASRADMQRYLDHPLHAAAVKEVIDPLTRKIIVYDFFER